MRSLKFYSCLALQIESFIRLRQLSGTDYQSQALLLCYFDRYLFEEKLEEPRLPRRITDGYLQTLAHLAPRVRYNRFCVVCQLCRYLSRTDLLTYVPEPIRAITPQAAHRPYIYSEAEIGALLQAYLKCRTPKNPAVEQLFLNANGAPVTRYGIRHITRKYAVSAQSQCQSLETKTVSPHTIRHTTAMHLLRAGNDINMVGYWLGHADINTTHVYVEIDMEMKLRMLTKAAAPLVNKALP